MTKKKQAKIKPIPFEEIDVARKTIGWHIDEILQIYKRIGPAPNNPRSLIGGTTADDTCVFLIFRGRKEDIFSVKEYLEGQDAQ
jgi:hypothetical protein